MKRYVSLAGAALVFASALAPLSAQARFENDAAALVPPKVPATEAGSEAQPAAEATSDETKSEASTAAGSTTAESTAGSSETEAPVQSATATDPSRLVPVSAPVAQPKSDEKPAGKERATAAAPKAVGLEKLIAAHAAQSGVPVALARAVIRVESNFNPGVTGRAGEVGLMQIKPATARGIGYGGSTKALYDPDTNIRWGMKYLAGAYNLAGGDVCGTIMRYQGGHYARRMTSASTSYCARVKRYMGSA